VQILGKHFPKTRKNTILALFTSPKHLQTTSNSPLKTPKQPKVIKPFHFSKKTQNLVVMIREKKCCGLLFLQREKVTPQKVKIFGVYTSHFVIRGSKNSIFSPISSFFDPLRASQSLSEPLRSSYV
jgi:hypothetical protein